MRLVSLATAAYMAKQQFMYANALEVSFGLIRMVATIIGCLAFGVSTVAAWSVWFFFAHLLAAGVGVWLILPDRHSALHHCARRDTHRHSLFDLVRLPRHPSDTPTSWCSACSLPLR